VGVRNVVGKIVQLALGAAVGCLLGGLITGNENYWIALVVGLPILFTVLGILGAAVASKRKLAEPGAVRQGIISTIPGLRIAPQKEAVLNPVSTAQPSSGVVLNGETVEAPKSTGNPPWWNVLSVLTIVVGAALVLLPSAQLISWTFSDIGQGRPFDGRDMTVGLHQQEAFDAIADKVGGTEVVAINFFPGSINVSAPSTPGARMVDLFTWKNGFASNTGPDFSQPSDLREELFDAGDIDMSVVGVVVRRSIDDAKLYNLDGVYPRITRAFDGGDPEISVSLTGDYFQAYYTYTVEGELIERSGTAFE
jgi:MFS family permease